MGNYSNDRRPSGQRSFGRRDFGSRGENRGFDRDGDRQMYQAVCSQCGKDCNLPFRPTNGKPVYCGDCFKNIRDKAPRQDFSRPQRSEFRTPPVDTSSHQFESLHAKLDKILTLLESKIVESKVAKEIISVLEPKNAEEKTKVKKTVKKKASSKKK